MRKTIFLILCFFISISFIEAKNIEFTECKYSEEYIKWDKLPERKKTQISKPVMCEIDSSSNVYLKGNASDSYFNLVDEGKVTGVKNQEDTNTCWAFSALASIESNLLMNNGPTLDLSEAHMELAYQHNFQMGYPSYNRIIGQGGNYAIASSYVLNGRGPVLENAYSFQKLLSVRQNNTFNLNEYNSVKPYLNVGSSYIYNGDNYQVSNKVCSVNDINKIKSTLVNYGAVNTRVYMSTEYLDSTTGAYHYDGSLTSNHAITIVGWNDNYTFNDKNLKSKPASKGAWIVKNSYGTSKYDKGYNYISYETLDICSAVNWYDDISVLDSTKEYNNYYYDELYYNMGLISYDKTVYMGTIYDKKSDKVEKLKSVKFASYIPGYSYKVYFSNNGNFTNTTLIGEGTVKEAGYTNVEVTKDINITSSKYSIIVALNSNNSSGTYIPLVAKITNDESYSNVEITSGVNYIGNYSSPATWSDLTTKNQAMLAIKSVTEVTDQSEIIEPDEPEEDIIIPPEENIPDEPNYEPDIKEDDVIPNEPSTPSSPSEEPEYDEGDKKEPGSSNNQVVIKPNKDNDVSYIEKTEEDVNNPKTGDLNGMLVFIAIIMILVVLVIGTKKLKKHNKM